MNHQVRKAVRIRRRGGAGNILNSRAEFNRCHIPRLVVEEEDQDTRLKNVEGTQGRDEQQGPVLGGAEDESPGASCQEEEQG